jgi:hypothetical protein
MATWLCFALFGAAANLVAVLLLWAALRTRVVEYLRLLRRRAVACAAVATRGAALGVLIGLIKAFGAVGGESVDPSQKARILAEDISGAMNCVAGGLVAAPLPIAALIAIAIRTRRAGAASAP